MAKEGNSSETACIACWLMSGTTTLWAEIRQVTSMRWANKTTTAMTMARKLSIKIIWAIQLAKISSTLQTPNSTILTFHSISWMQLSRLITTTSIRMSINQVKRASLRTMTSWGNSTMRYFSFKSEPASRAMLIRKASTRYFLTVRSIGDPKSKKCTSRTRSWRGK